MTRVLAVSMVGVATLLAQADAPHAKHPVAPLSRPLRPIIDILPKGMRRVEPTAKGEIDQGARKILVNGNVPGGTVVSQCQRGPSYPPIYLGTTTVGAALSRWLENNASYVVRVFGGVINVVPKMGVPPMLGTPIPRFDYDGRRDRALQHLEDLPEVRAAKRIFHLRQIFRGGLVSSWVPPAIHVHLHNTSYMQVLDAISKAEESGVWYYREIGCGTEPKGLAVGFSSEGPLQTDRVDAK